MIIYKATNKIDGKCYIGQTINSLNDRKITHKCHGKKDNNYFHNALKKYGFDNFEWKIIEECSSKEEMDEMEFHYIKQYDSYKKKNGYNITMGGEGTQLFGKANGMYGKKHSEESIEKMRKIKKGKKHTKESKQKISNATKGKNNPMYGTSRCGKDNPMYGKKHSEETKRKISESLKRRNKGK
jgi:group I intron endonuclease